MTTTETVQEFPRELYAAGANPPEVRAKVPFAVDGGVYIPRERYYDRAFFDLEKEHLWPHAWQMAARLEEIPRPGDYVEYQLLDTSVLIIRQPDESVKALHNACRHRATELLKGAGHVGGGQIVCPFHGWRWNLDGSSSSVFMAEFFDPESLEADELRLRECKVELWAGMVWINMDPAAPPLQEALAPIPSLLDPLGLGNMRVKWWKQVVLDANWKVTIEAFLEGYHVMQTHPQLLMGGGEEAGAGMATSTEYTAFRGGHGRFQTHSFLSQAMSADAFLELARLAAGGQDAGTLQREVEIFEAVAERIGDDEEIDFAQEAIKGLYDHAEGAGIPMPALSEHTRLWGGEAFVFPNMFFLPMYGNCLSYRMRPHADDPEKTLFDVWSLMTYPSGEEPDRAVCSGVFDKEDADAWLLIPRQDFSNIERQQRGLRSPSFEKMRLSPTFETTIANLHQEVDRMIARAR